MEEKKVQLLDCTLRDGAYIVDANFGTPAIKGIIQKMQDANIEIIECGWLKNTEHTEGTTFYHTPDDLSQYVIQHNPDVTYVVMIDWDRYNLEYLPTCTHNSVDAIRVVFPYGKHKEGIEVAKKIKKKGYGIYLQAANTLAYSDEDLKNLAKCINDLNPIAISIVDTFGAMYEEDLDRIINVLNAELNPEIKMGFHSHNNQQLSFALCMHFIKIMDRLGRACIVDGSLCGMGRGAGNATTELVASYLNRKYHANYDMNSIMDAIDTYMEGFKENYRWGYSTPYFIAGMYCCHVNNIAYLLKNHRTNAKNMRNIIESLSADDRKKYDYDLLEKKYIENQGREIDDTNAIEKIKSVIGKREVLLVAPGKTADEQYDKISQYIKENNPVVIGVNAINTKYNFDFLIFINSVRYDYAKTTYFDVFSNTPKILLSNIKTKGTENEYIVNFNRAVKYGWEHFDNAVIFTLRLLLHLHVKNIKLAGFDGFKHEYNASYADASLPTLNPDDKWDELNEEIKEIFRDLKETTDGRMDIQFLTDSIFDEK